VEIKGINEIDIKGKKVFIRVDFNVPLDEKLEITNDKRIRASIPTIEYAVNQCAKVILASHLGRPKGKKKPELSLKPIAKRLSELLGKNVLFADDVVGRTVREAINSLKDGDILLLENLRFYPFEEANDEQFSKELASYCDVYINDAFGTAHRAHASTEGMARFAKEVGCGFLMKKEIEYLSKVIENPERPFIAILGGAKVSDKIGVIKNLLKKVDALIIGGAMSYTFLKAKGILVGKSLVEDDKLEIAREILLSADSSNVKLMLPLDHIVVDKIDAKSYSCNSENENIPDNMIGVDIGSKTIQIYLNEIEKGKTIFWNGPMGIFEIEPFSKGTFAIAKGVAKCSGTTVVGGGDSVSAVSKANVSDKITHISTGGGASLEFIEGIELPGVKALKR